MSGTNVKRKASFLTGVTILILFSFSCSNTEKESVSETKRESVEVPISPAKDDRPVILAFGDSLTEGAGVDPSQNYPFKLQAKLNTAGYRYRVVNGGISGETTSQGLNRVQTYRALHPVIVIVELGANDGLRGLPVETTHRNLNAIVSQFKSMGAKVILAGMEVPPNYGRPYTTSFRKIFPSVAEDNKVELIPFFLEGVGGHPEFNQDDGIHPTAEGYDIIVENIWKILKPVL